MEPRGCEWLQVLCEARHTIDHSSEHHCSLDGGTVPNSYKEDKQVHRPVFCYCSLVDKKIYIYVLIAYKMGMNCSLSLWRVVRGIKLMHLDLIHGLFIT